MAEWLGKGLQNLVQRFESACRLFFFAQLSSMNEHFCKIPSSTLVCVTPGFVHSGANQNIFTSLNVRGSKYFIFLASFFPYIIEAVTKNYFFQPVLNSKIA